jgi:hypothetical protein
MAVSPLAPAIEALGRPEGEVHRHPVLHGNGQTLVTFARPATKGTVGWVGVWLTPGEVRFLGEAPSSTESSRAHGLAGPAAELFDRVVDVARQFIGRIEELDEQLSEAQQRGRAVPLTEVWKLQRGAAVLRAQIGRTLVAVAELGGPFGARFPGLAAAFPSLEGELTRVQQLCANVQQSLSDLILLRNAEESNRIAVAANELSLTSNRIASLANVSNIRMLGLTYIALILGLVSAVVLFPNTAATILGMPSAAWVPGLWVDLILFLVAVIPLLVVLRPRWVRHLLEGLGSYESRASEGISDLAELPPEPPGGQTGGTQRL